METIPFSHAYAYAHAMLMSLPVYIAYVYACVVTSRIWERALRNPWKSGTVHSRRMLRSLFSEQPAEQDSIL